MTAKTHDIRPVRSTDLVALLTFGARSFPSKAKTRDQIGKKDRGAGSLEKLIEQWLPGGNHRAWVALQDGSIVGLVSVRNRIGRSVWEVENLLLAAQGGEEHLAGELLETVARSAEYGVEKVFLRVIQDSQLITSITTAGFTPYVEEYLYRRDRISDLTARDETVPNPYVLRQCTGDDTQPLFELYRAAVPASVRQAEGITFSEWEDSREESWGWRGRKELVLEREGRLVGWLNLRATRSAGYFDLVAHPQDAQVLNVLLNRTLAHFSGKSAIFCLGPSYQESLCRRLEAGGFEAGPQYVMLVKQLTVRLKEARLVPVVA